MIDTEKLDKKSYTNKIMQMYEKLNTELVKDIIYKIESNKVDITFTKEQIRVLAKRGGAEIYKSTIKKSNALSKDRKKYLLELFEEVIQDDIKDYKNMYEYQNKKLKLTKQQMIILKKMVRLTDKELNNFTKTIAFVTKEEFVNAVDRMYQQVVTGGIDINSAFQNTTNELAKKGVTLKMKNGKNRSIEAAVRQNVLYGVRQTAQLVENDLIDYLGADAVEFNITPNCRHSHIPINGKIFSLDKNNKKYPYFKPQYEELLQDYGCQHYKSPFIIGVSEPINTPEEIKKADNKTVTYRGEKISYYDATQKQRALERNIRKAKKIYMSNPSKENKIAIKKAENRIVQYTKKTGLERDRDREFYAGYKKF